MSRIIDISLPITQAMPVYPGTAPTTVTPVPSASGNSVLSEVRLTTHAGTHVDAPNHIRGGGEGGIDSFPLDIFFGPCRVLDMTGCQSSISQKDLQPHAIQPGERILLKTNNSVRGFDEFYDDYVFVEGVAAHYLATVGVALVGIDALSIKQRGSQDNTAHTALLSKGVPIIEGLRLTNAAPGAYGLAAFPLAFRGIDGSPIRAVLIEE